MYIYMLDLFVNLKLVEVENYKKNNMKKKL